LLPRLEEPASPYPWVCQSFVLSSLLPNLHFSIPSSCYKGSTFISSKKNPNKQKTRQLEGEQEWKRDTRLEWEKRGTARDESSHHLQLPHFFISVINGFL
jgi:hypothetical protein